jgi:hypothetical protein
MAVDDGRLEKLTTAEEERCVFPLRYPLQILELDDPPSGE